jgi:hypothetical protein
MPIEAIRKNAVSQLSRKNCEPLQSTAKEFLRPQCEEDNYERVLKYVAQIHLNSMGKNVFPRDRNDKLPQITEGDADFSGESVGQTRHRSAFAKAGPAKLGGIDIAALLRLDTRPDYYR